MDDYITKPVRPDVIAAVIERWVRSSAHIATVAVPVDEVPTPAPAPEPVTPPTVVEERDVLDLGQIGLLRSLDDGEGMVLAEVISEYLDQSLVQRDALADALAAGDAYAIERSAHALRGASANVGGARLAEICGELEALGRAEAVASAALLLEMFDEEWGKVCDALSHLVVRA
jgi:HPt (histidine-containing phosphotransfer) domain-containing protein